MIRSSYNKFDKLVPFEIKPGEVTKVNIVFGQTGTVEITASEKEGGKWVESANYISKDDEGKPGESVASAHSSKKKAGTATIPVGKYMIRSTYKGFKKLTPFEIAAGETTKVHVVFGQFFIGAKCSDMQSKVNYEVYARSGQLIGEKVMACSNTWKMTLDDGDYSVEAKIDSGTGEAKFSVGAGKPNKLILDLTNLNHEEEIKADSQEAVTVEAKSKKEEAAKEVVVQEKQGSEKITIGNKQIEIKGISKEDADKIKNLGAMLGALGGMMQGGNSAQSKEEKAKQEAKNAKADKEFEEMGKDLDMVTK